jgi:hypothetical protein
VVHSVELGPLLQVHSRIILHHRTATVSNPPGEGPGAHRIDLGYRASRKGIEYDGEEFHAGASERAYDERRRTTLERDHGWVVIGVGRGEVLGPSLTLEYALGEFLGMEPQIRRRLW